MFETLSICAIVLVAAFLQGLTGFGFVLIALPLLSFFIDIKTSIPLMVLLALSISLYLSVRLRKDINVKSIYVLMVTTLPGILLGTYVLTTVPPQILSLCVGFMMVLFTVYQLIAEPTPQELGILPTSFAGFISGVLAGSIAAGGPPIIVYSALQPWSKDQAKATLAAYFATSGLVVAFTHGYNGLITNEVLKLFTINIPALLGGIWLGTITYKRISDHGYKKLAFVLVFILGSMMIYRNIQ